MRAPGSVLIAGTLAAVVAACGESAASRAARETLAGAAPVADAFVADLAAGRTDVALARATPAFRAAAAPAALDTVVTSLRAALGVPGPRTPREARDLAPDPSTGPARSAVLVLDVKFERGSAEVVARVVRDGPAAPWLVDACEVRTPEFVWTFRTVGVRPEGG